MIEERHKAILPSWEMYAEKTKVSSDYLLGITPYNYFTGSADDAYKTIRASTSDIKIIAQNTGIKTENIFKIKNHLFYQKHVLDKYVKYGVPAETRRFDSDLAIANTWKRLENGNYTEQDIKLLKHEAAESWYMSKYGPSYTVAHEAAHKRYPAPELSDGIIEVNKSKMKQGV